jgi:hypothetical protein
VESCGEGGGGREGTYLFIYLYVGGGVEFCLFCR